MALELSMFSNDHESDPYRDQMVIGVYGEPGVGKTTMLLNLVRQHKQVVFIISMDRGMAAVRTLPRGYKRLFVAYPKSYEETKRTVAEVVKAVPRLIKEFNVDGSSIWVAIDTVTHMQTILLRESQLAQIDRMDSSRRRRQPRPDDKHALEMTTQLDWGINLSQMSAIIQYLRDGLNTNIVLVMLEKRIEENKRSIVLPQLSGQSLTFVEGTCDILARMSVQHDGSRILRCEPTLNVVAKNRFAGRIEPVESPDLMAIRQKVFS